MRTVITSTGNKLSSRIDLRFGRAAWFCLYEDETGKATFKENLYLDAGQGSGQKAVEIAHDLGAAKIISGDFGPKAKDLLDRLNIQMIIIDDDNHTVKDIINKLK